MKRAPLLLIAMLPFMAGAANDKQAAEVDQQKLKDAVPVTEIVGQDVQTRDGQEFGELETVAFKQDGSVAYYGIEPEMDMYDEANAAFNPGEDEALYEGTTDDVADGGDPLDDDTSAFTGDYDYQFENRPRTREDIEAATTEGGRDDLIRVEPGKIGFEDGGNVVTIDLEPGELIQEQSGGSADSNLLDATDIVGMQVDLADAESFGEVEDVMISKDGKEAVALVVDNWDGANKERRALPAKLQAVNTETESIEYDFGRDALSETGNFELEQYMDDM